MNIEDICDTEPTVYSGPWVRFFGKSIQREILVMTSRPSVRPSPRTDGRGGGWEA